MNKQISYYSVCLFFCRIYLSVIVSNIRNIVDKYDVSSIITNMKIVMKEGLFAIIMRTVANECKVAVGSIYNYFPSKADLVSATIEVIWEDILHMTGGSFDFVS